MQRIASGDEAALSAIYDRYSRCVFSLLARMLRDDARAEEILQDVFLYIWRNASQFNPDRGMLSTWLLVMARSRAISNLRRKQTENHDEIAESQVSSNAVPPDISAIQGEVVARVRSLLAGLPVEQREVFHLAYFSGMTHAEIAERTGQPLGTVKSRLRSTLANLRQAFGS